MEAISRVIEFLGWLQEALYKAYREILDLPWPFYLAAWPFYLAADAVNRIAWAFYDFWFWVEDAADKIRQIISWPEIWQNIKDFWYYIDEMNRWFPYWWDRVSAKVNSWYTEKRQDVLDWIDAAKDWAKLWIDWLDERLNAFLVVWSDFVNITWPQFTSQLSSLLAEWNTFITVTLPSLPRWLEIEELLDTLVKSLTPFWEGWQELRDKVTEFFTDPEDWLYKSLDRIVERFW